MGHGLSFYCCFKIRREARPTKISSPSERWVGDLLEITYEAIYGRVSFERERHGHKVDGGLYYLDFMGENYLFHKLYVASSL